MESIVPGEMNSRIEGNGVHLRTREAGGLTLGWVSLAKGVDLAPATVGLQDDLCQCPHWGFVIKGKVRMKTQDGSQDFAAGQAFYWAPGHAPEALEDSEYVDVSPTDEFEAVIAHVSRDG